MDLAARHAHSGVTLPYRLLVGSFDEAEDLAISVVKDLELARPKLVMPAALGIGRQCLHRLGRQLEVRMVVDELRHDQTIPYSAKKASRR